MKKIISTLILTLCLICTMCSCNVVDTVTEVNGKINGFVWGWFGVILLVGTGIIMTILTKVFQITHIGHWFKETLGSLFKKDVTSHVKEKGTISQFQALCTALAATIGVGNIAGVAAAIVTGGPGAVFWMWVAAFFGMMTNLVFSTAERTKTTSGQAVLCTILEMVLVLKKVLKLLVKFYQSFLLASHF